MIGGQVMDIKSGLSEDLDLPLLEEINAKKTGRLIRVSCLAGAISADISSEEERRILRFGEHLGFAFQLVDDIMDGDGYLKFMNEREARRLALESVQKAKQELDGFRPRKEALERLADFVVERTR